MIPGIDPGLSVLLFSLAVSAVGGFWVWWSDRRFIRKYGPDPSDVKAAPPSASRREG